MCSCASQRYISSCPNKPVTSNLWCSLVRSLFFLFVFFFFFRHLSNIRMLLLHTKWKAKILLAQRLGVPLISQDLKLLTQMEGPKSKKNIFNPAIILRDINRIMEGTVCLDHTAFCRGIIGPVVVLWNQRLIDKKWSSASNVNVTTNNWTSPD